MNEFMKVLLSLSVSGALLSSLILGLKPLYGSKFSRGWQYYIWIIAVLRFLLPLTPDTSIVGNLFERIEAAAITNEVSVEPEIFIAGSTDHEKTEPVQANADHGEAEPVQTNADHGETQPVQANTDMNRNVTSVAAHKLFHRYNLLFFIWIIPAMVLFIRKAAVYQGFIRHMREGNREVSDIRILNLLSGCKEKLNIKTKVELYHNSLIDSPMLIGFFHPGIILPVRELEDKELFYIFVHELTHCRQRDMLYKWLIQIVVCVHWFNPFVYLLEREVNRSCELSCDEKVLSVLDDSEKREYGDMLISFLRPGSLCKNSLTSVTLTEGAKQMKERLRAIMNFRKKSKGTVIITSAFTVAAGFLFFVAGAYAAPSAVNRNAVWKDSEIQNEMLTEEGVYYIFCDGAGEKDKPQASVSIGSVQFVIVRKDGWTSVGPFDNKETLVEDAAKQCAYMKNLTEKEKELLIEAAAEIHGNQESEGVAKYGAIGMRQSADKKSTMTIIHESADIFHYEDGSPYIHSILANHTDRTMIETQYCMLAYDENGSPLKLYWNFLDSSAGSSFEHIVRTKTNILPGQTEKYRGGWSLYDDETMKSFRKTGNDETKQAAYALLCLKQVVFEDGSVWDNPDYEDWFELYAGKETDTEELQNYYPHEYSLGSCPHTAQYP